jgi:hypothetical protein
MMRYQAATNRGDSKMNGTEAQQAQLEKFKQAAHELECNEDEDAFKRSLRAIAKAPVEKKAAKPK